MATIKIKVRIKLLYDPANPLLNLYYKIIDVRVGDTRQAPNLVACERSPRTGALGPCKPQGSSPPPLRPRPGKPGSHTQEWLPAFLRVH